MPEASVTAIITDPPYGLGPGVPFIMVEQSTEYVEMRLNE